MKYAASVVVDVDTEVQRVLATPTDNAKPVRVDENNSVLRTATELAVDEQKEVRAGVWFRVDVRDAVRDDVAVDHRRVERDR